MFLFFQFKDFLFLASNDIKLILILYTHFIRNLLFFIGIKFIFLSC